MSWTGFKKAVSRATTTVLLSTGAIEKTTDPAFDSAERRFTTFSQKVDRLYKESKSYLDAVRSLTLSLSRIASTIELFYEDGTNLGYAAITYKDAITKLDERGRAQLDEGFRKGVLDPLGKYASTFPEYNEAIKKRHKKLLDYDRSRSSVKTLVEKPSGDASKLPRVEQEALAAKEVYETVNSTLLSEIPRLIDLRVPFLDPCFEALVKCQLEFNIQAKEALENVRGKFGGVESTGGGMDEAQAVLSKIRDLAICAG